VKIAKFLSFVALSLLVFAATSCSDDENPLATQEFGEISGKVTFVGNWPQTGDVQISIWASWPPTGPPAAATDPLQTGVASVDYKIEGLSKGMYPVITAGWRDPNNPQGAKVIGIYWDQSDSLGVDGLGNPMVAPRAIEIKDSQMVFQNIDIKANLDIVK
jgi:hypothetical protein